MKPFIKWVGGKRSVVPELIKRIPETYTKYYEPFIGGGAMFFGLQPSSSTISDSNEKLINTYIALRDHLHSVIAQTNIYMNKHNKNEFLKIRKQFSIETDSIKQAAMFLYLNKTCFNGLYRENKHGEFNVPMGKYKNPPTLTGIDLISASSLLQNTEIKCQSFYKTNVEAGAFYYFDPPYHKTYSSYNSDGFSEKQHEDLFYLCEQIDCAGGFFMLSNSNTPLINQLYGKYNIELISAKRSVSCKASQRKKENELIIRNYD